MAVNYQERAGFLFPLSASTSSNGHDRNGHSPSSKLHGHSISEQSIKEQFLDRIELQLLDKLQLAGTYPDKHGLLATPFEFSDELSGSLASYHRVLASSYGDAYFNFTSQGEKPILEKVINSSGWRIRVLPLTALSGEEMAAIVHAQIACYEGKDTMGAYATTRKKKELNLDDLSDQEIRTNERRLISEMVRGWDGDEVLAVLDCLTQEGKARRIFAGGVMKFGQQHDISAVQAWLQGSSTVPSFKALRLIDGDNQQYPENGLKKFVDAPENKVGCVTRLFSMLSIKKDEIEAAGVDLNQVLGVSNLIMCYLALQNKDIDWVISDTHLPALHRYSRENFGGQIIAQGKDQLVTSPELVESVHEAHYGYWLTERGRISISISRSSDHVRGATQLIEKMNASWKVQHPGYELPAIESEACQKRS